MHKTSTRDCKSPSSTLFAMISPALIFQSSNHTRSPALFNRSANWRTRGLSLWLWLRKTSKENVSAMCEFPRERRVPIQSRTYLQICNLSAGKYQTSCFVFARSVCVHPFDVSQRQLL